jgi:hypothetical protein
MPRGGWRPGAGRPPGSKNLRHKDISLDRALGWVADLPPDERPNLGQGETPLQYICGWFGTRTRTRQGGIEWP